MTEQEHSHAIQGRNEVKWRLGQETSFALPRSNLRSFGSKVTVLKNLHVTVLSSRGHLAPPAVIRRPGNCSNFLHRYAPDAITTRLRHSHAIRKDRSDLTAAFQGRRY